MVIFHSYVNVYQRVTRPFSYGFPMVFLWFSYVNRTFIASINGSKNRLRSIRVSTIFFLHQLRGPERRGDLLNIQELGKTWIGICIYIWIYIYIYIYSYNIHIYIIYSYSYSYIYIYSYLSIYIYIYTMIIWIRLNIIQLVLVIYGQFHSRTV